MAPLRARIALLTFVCLSFIVLPPAAVHGHFNSQLTYIQQSYANGTYETPGYDHRHYNQVWHTPGYDWWVMYKLTDGSGIGLVNNDDNPTRWPYDVAYAKAQCWPTTPYTDPDQFTCQTTT